VSESEGKILIVDDDTGTRQALRGSLGMLGFTVREATSGEQSLLQTRQENFDALLLDINMPGMGGFEACRELRRLSPHLPIVMMTVRDATDDKIEALDAGADDYVTKPFDVRELAARIRAAVRRGRTTTNGQATKTIVIGDLELDPVRSRIRKAGQIVRLTPKEFQLLHHLMAHPGMPMTHASLLRAVWGPEYGNELEYLRTFVRQLRKKIEQDPANPEYLLTDPYIGYRFRDPSD
jgi:two-component system KDP operon response regulator KdpE